MLQCKKIQEVLKADYLDKELGAKEEQLVKEHLKQCSGCRVFEKELQAQRMFFQGVKRQQVPEHIWSNIRDAIVTQRLKQEAGLIPGILQRLRNLLSVRKPAVVLATSLFSIIIILALFTNAAIQNQIFLNKKVAAENIAGYSLADQNGYVLYDLGTGIEEYFL